MTIRMKAAAALIAALAMFSTAGAALAQSAYPDRAVKLVLGYPPGN